MAISIQSPTSLPSVRSRRITHKDCNENVSQISGGSGSHDKEGKGFVVRLNKINQLWSCDRKGLHNRTRARKESRERDEDVLRRTMWIDISEESLLMCAYTGAVRRRS